ncbi:MAG TPA: phosphopantetheine-binding protein [Streptosporangiaceae bacterium]|nr:phosphopantetheine-binding protein [Streptosporangiaceae bacterium]
MAANLDVEFRQRVFDAVRLILPRLLGRNIPAIADSTELRGQLGLRSASTLELLLELEDSLEIEIDVEQIGQGNMNTVGDLTDFVARHSTKD